MRLFDNLAQARKLFFEREAGFVGDPTNNEAGTIFLLSGGFSQRERELSLACFVDIVEGFSGAIAFGGLEIQSAFEAVWQACKASFAIDICADLQIQLAGTCETVRDVNLHLGGINRFIVDVDNREVCGARADASVYGGDRVRVGCLGDGCTDEG